MKKKSYIWICRTFLLVALITWMSVIFAFSGQEGTESSGVSQKVSQWTAQSYSEILHPEMTQEEVLQMAVWIEHPVRKLAHMTEFGILSLLGYLTLTSFGKKKWRNVIAVVFTFCYASLDEFHQIFIPGRHGCFPDVCIDTSGAILVMLFVYFIQRCYDGIHRRKYKRKDCARQNA